MRTVVIGNRELAVETLEYMLLDEWGIVGTISAAGEGARKQAGYVSLTELADKHDVETTATTDINSSETKSWLRDLDPDLCVCPGWHQIINESVLSIPERGFVGVHSSDLPRGRGGAPINWAIINGESEIAVSLFYYSSGVDAGDIVHKEYVPIEDRDDVDTVLGRISLAIRDGLAKSRSKFESESVNPEPQAVKNATYRPRRQPQDGIVDWSQSTRDLFNWVRSQTDPYPGSYTFIEKNKIKIISSNIGSKSSVNTSPGTVVEVVEGSGVDVATGDGILQLERVQVGAGPEMWADDFARRYDVGSGDTFGRDQAPDSWCYTGLRAPDGTTDFASASNLRLGSRGEVLAVVESPSRQTIELRATLDGEPICTERVTHTGRESVPIQYRPESTGTHTLKLEFYEDDSMIDRRYLKVFVWST